MIRFDQKHVRRSESGIALFIAIFTLLLITAIAAGMIMMTNTDTNISSNFRDEQTAFFGAKAGLEEVRDRMRVNANNGATPPVSVSLNYTNPLAIPPSVSLLPGATNPNAAPPIPGQTGGVVYVLNPLNGETVTPWNITGATSVYPDTEICVEMSHMSPSCGGSPLRPLPASSTWYSSTSASSTYASNPVMAWKWTRINVKTNQTSSGTTTVSTVDGDTSHTNQLVCWDGNHELVTTYASCALGGAALVPAQNYMPVYVLTSLAVTPTGSRRMVQMDVATDVLPNIPGAMVMDGASPVFGPGSSNAFTATGTDNSNSTPPNPLRPQNGTTCPPPGNVPAVGGYNAASATTITNTFTGGGPNRSGNYTGTPGGVANVGTALGAGGMNTVQGLNALVSTITASAIPANTYTNAAALTNPGIPSAPVINVVTGDLTLGGSFSGSGILLVEGTLTFTGNPSYNGVILVVGKGVVNWSGGGSGVIDGAMLVANLYNSATPPQPLTSGAPGSPTITFSGSGNMTIQYDSCWVAAMNQMAPYKSLGVREMTY